MKKLVRLEISDLKISGYQENGQPNLQLSYNYPQNALHSNTTINRFISINRVFANLLESIVNRDEANLDCYIYSFLGISLNILEILETEQIIDGHENEFRIKKKKFNNKHNELIKLRNGMIHLGTTNTAVNLVTNLAYHQYNGKEIETVIENTGIFNARVDFYEIDYKTKLRTKSTLKANRYELTQKIIGKGHINKKKISEKFGIDLQKEIIGSLEQKKYIMCNSQKETAVTHRFPDSYSKFELSDTIPEDIKKQIYEIIRSSQYRKPIADFLSDCFEFIIDTYNLILYFCDHQPEKEKSGIYKQLVFFRPHLCGLYIVATVACMRINDYSGNYKENLAKALEFSDKSLELCDNQDEKANIYFNRGLIFYDKANISHLLSDIGKAIDCLENSLALGNSNSEVYLYLAYSYDRHEIWKRALTHYIVANAITPNSEAMFGISRIYRQHMKGKKLSVALDLMIKATSLNPQNHLYWLELIYIRMELQQNHEQIIVDIRQALQNVHQKEELLLVLAYNLVLDADDIKSTEQYQQAYEIIQSIVERNPDYATMFFIQLYRTIPSLNSKYSMDYIKRIARKVSYSRITGLQDYFASKDNYFRRKYLETNEFIELTEKSLVVVANR